MQVFPWSPRWPSRSPSSRPSSGTVYCVQEDLDSFSVIFEFLAETWSFSGYWVFLTETLSLAETWIFSETLSFV